ncbi:MAG: hypothetical protein AAF628_03425 [Planctomycetota bacterium]
MFCALTLATATAQEPAPPAPETDFWTEVRRIDGIDAVVLADGRRLRLAGLSLPAEAVRPKDLESRLIDLLRARLIGGRTWIEPEGANAAGDDVDLTGVARPTAGAPSANAEALEQGLAVLSYRTPQTRAFAALQAAAATAQRERRGWFDRPHPAGLEPLPYLNGAVLGLHYQEDRFEYHSHLDELADLGFRHLCLLLSAFAQDATSSTIRLDHPRTVSDERLLDTIAYAKGKGMTVLLLPIVLLEDPGENDWRGTLRPRDEGAFWLSYDGFLSHYLDLAEAAGADAFSVGSEFSSLERRHDAWRRIIANARGRFRGALTYSANWDHVHVPRFFGLLDFVGMTAYFSLSDKDDPSPDELTAGWQKVAKDLNRAVGMLGKPVVFTELGYPSQNGCNRDPWNYYMARDDIDVEEQRQCFEAFLRVAPEMRFLGGAYWYDFFDDGGPEDHSYSPRGKPALAAWERWAAYSPK